MVRDVVGEAVECLGYVQIDKKRNSSLEDGVIVDIGEKDDLKSGKILVCRTDEQLEMARACALDDKFWS